MNIKEYIQLAKKVLNEDAGSEGMMYQIAAKSGLKALETDIVKVYDLKSENGVTTANVSFAYPHDYGFALDTLKNLFENLDLVSLSLIY
jgi:hypothetical protein